MDETKKALLKSLPKIDELMLFLGRRKDLPATSPEIIKAICRSEVESLRLMILNLKGVWDGPFPSLESVAERVIQASSRLHRYRLRRVINATGVILHTNLGRAPLCLEALEHVLEISRGYSNLEYDLAKGERGLRYDHIRELLTLLTGAEDAIIVNNNAAAVLLVLNTLAEGKEAIVSRGELIEIGGEFRVPEVMEKSGGRLKEVGTTNRTRLKDYETAISSETALIMKVHTSNFRMIGFTEDTNLIELVALGKKYGIPVMDDLGSGCFIDLAAYGLCREPTVQEVLASGVDIVTFSGDKLLGGPQAGLILGKKAILEKIKKNPLNRALRIDKLTLAALEATMIQYLHSRKCLEKVHTLKALTESGSEVMKRARRIKALLGKLPQEKISVVVTSGFSMAGGGSLPAEEIPTTLIRLNVKGLSTAALESRLRNLETPIIARIDNDHVFLDVRTIMDDELTLIRNGLIEMLSEA